VSALLFLLKRWCHREPSHNSPSVTHNINIETNMLSRDNQQQSLNPQRAPCVECNIYFSVCNNVVYFVSLSLTEPMWHMLRWICHGESKKPTRQSKEDKKTSIKDIRRFFFFPLRCSCYIYMSSLYIFFFYPFFSLLISTHDYCGFITADADKEHLQQTWLFEYEMEVAGT